MNTILITSVLIPENIPLSYSSTRNPFSKEDRFSQTIKALQSLDRRIWKKIIFIDKESIEDYKNGLQSYINECAANDAFGMEYELYKRFNNIKSIDELGVAGIVSCDFSNYIEV